MHVGPHPRRLNGTLGTSHSSAPFRNRSEAFDTAWPSQSFEQAKVPRAVLPESPIEARPERTARRTHPCGRRNEAAQSQLGLSANRTTDRLSVPHPNQQRRGSKDSRPSLPAGTFLRWSFLADVPGPHDRQPLEHGSVQVRVGNAADPLGPGRHGSIYAPDHWVRRPCGRRRWCHPLSDVQPCHSRATLDVEVSELRQRSTLSVPPMASQSACTGVDGNQVHTLRSPVPSIRRTADRHPSPRVFGSPVVLDDVRSRKEAARFQDLLQQPSHAYLTGRANTRDAGVTTNRKSPLVWLAAPLSILISDPNGWLTFQIFGLTEVSGQAPQKPRMKSRALCALGCSAFRDSDRFTVTRSVQKGRGISLSWRDLRVISPSYQFATDTIFPWDFPSCYDSAMSNLVPLFVHFLATLARLLGPSLTFGVNCSKMLVCVLSLPADS